MRGSGEGNIVYEREGMSKWGNTWLSGEFADGALLLFQHVFSILHTSGPHMFHRTL